MCLVTQQDADTLTAKQIPRDKDFGSVQLYQAIQGYNLRVLTPFPVHLSLTSAILIKAEVLWENIYFFKTNLLLFL